MSDSTWEAVDEERMRRQIFQLYETGINPLLQPVDVKNLHKYLECAGKDAAKMTSLFERDAHAARVAIIEALKSNVDAIAAITEIIKNRDENLYGRLRMEGLCEESLRCFRLFFQTDDTIDAFVMLMNYEDVLLSLEKDHRSTYEQLCVLVRKAKNRSDIEEACKVLMRELPYTTSDEKWYWDFMRALNAHADNIGLCREIDPNFAKHYSTYENARLAPVSSKMKMNGAGRAEEDEDASDDENASDSFICRPQSSFAAHAPKYGQSVRDRVKPIKLRDYQKELAEPAKEGKNVIVCAPTGSGKTIVAAAIIRHHLDQTSDQQPRRVAMLVPTVPLVDQQMIMLLQYLQDKYFVIGFAGGEFSGVKAPQMLACHVIIMTPQILVNMLNSTMKADKLNFADFSLFIFDECHHTNERHPYNVLMEAYHDYAGPSKPQVVGLTASLGVGSGKTTDTAIEHMLRMSANLACENLSIVTKHIDDLRAHVPLPEDVLEEVNPLDKDVYGVHIQNLMQQIELSIKPRLIKLAHLRNCLRPEDVKIPQYRESDEYQSWYSRLLRNRLPLLSNNELKRELSKSVQLLKVYHRSLELNSHLPTAFAVRFLQFHMKNFAENAASSADQELLDKYKSKEQYLLAAAEETLKKPIVVKLRDVLKKQYEEKPDARTIIFVRTREMTNSLTEYLNYDPVLEGVFAASLTSANSSAAQGGMGMNEQRSHLEQFNSGAVKILVATTVAEEGLDIAKCNLIVKYNHVSNEVAMVQRRGRGRAEGSKSVLIAQSGCVAEKELLNMQKEKLMDLCLQHLRNQGEAFFKAQVHEKVQEMRSQRELDRTALEVRRIELGDKRFDLLCRLCNALVCSSYWIRRVQNAHYVSVDPQIWLRGNVLPLKRPLAHGLTTVAGQFVCAYEGCGHEWGIIVKYNGVFLPGIKADGFIIQSLTDDHIETSRTQKRQWSLIERTFFVVDQITEKDKKRMLKGLLALSSESQAMLEEQANKAEADAAEEARNKANMRERQRLDAEADDAAVDDDF
uniref:RNA helicase n=1 Tax=Plectus sambesii TaxID=2011161 RepID=A0A914UPT3_9BILA